MTGADLPMGEEPVEESVTLDEDQIQAILGRVVLSKENYAQLYDVRIVLLRSFFRLMGRCLIFSIISLYSLSERYVLSGFIRNTPPHSYSSLYLGQRWKERIDHVEDILTLGDKVRCKCMGKDKMGNKHSCLSCSCNGFLYNWSCQSMNFNIHETFESNGSTSMASTCASCMALMAAGVPIKRMVAGISCGLVTGETDDDYIVLTEY